MRLALAARKGRRARRVGGTKIAQVIELLQRGDGATLAELVAATGWLPHTTRGAALAILCVACGAKYGYDKDHRPILTREPKLVLNNLEAGKIENFWLMYGRRPYAAFGNSSSDDQQILEYVKAGTGARLSALVLHDDATREYAYGPAQGLPDTKIGTFSQEMYDMAKQQHWTIISMKNDWKRIFAFEA